MGKGSAIMSLNSVGGSTMQLGTGRDLLCLVLHLLFLVFFIIMPLNNVKRYHHVLGLL